MPHRIQIFSGGCELCDEAIDIVELGKCKDCKMDVIPVDAKSNRAPIKRYRINAVPSIVIDGKIKVVGVPTFPWFCGDELYRKLEKEYPLRA